MIVVACATAVAASQAPQHPSTFRVAVDVVAIDAVVTDRKGEAVRDLTAADFEVFQDGKRQTRHVRAIRTCRESGCASSQGERVECGSGACGTGGAACAGAVDRARAGAADDHSRRR